jgi:hypothetical protein
MIMTKVLPAGGARVTDSPSESPSLIMMIMTKVRLSEALIDSDHDYHSDQVDNDYGSLACLW